MDTASCVSLMSSGPHSNAKKKLAMKGYMMFSPKRSLAVQVILNTMDKPLQTCTQSATLTYVLSYSHSKAHPVRAKRPCVGTAAKAGRDDGAPVYADTNAMGARSPFEECQSTASRGTLACRVA